MPPTRRRWLTFSLRAMLTLATALCIALGIWTNRAHQQRIAVQQLQQVAAWVGYDRRVDDLGLPAPLRSFLGDDFFANVVAVHLSHPMDGRRVLPLSTEQLDQGVAAMQRLPHLRTLHIEHTQLRDEDLVQLSPLRNQIELIEIHESLNSKVTGSGIKHFKGWPRLRNLLVYSGLLDAQPLSGAADIPNLESLTWSHCELNADAFAVIARCQQLRRLGLFQCSFDGHALAELNAAKRLESIMLHNIQGESASNSNDLEELDEHEPQYRFSPSSRYIDARLSVQGSTNQRSLVSEKWFRQKLPGVQVYSMTIIR
jgi:hypothetical protein